MRQPTRHTAVLVLLSLLASFVFAVTTTAGTANAADSAPTLQWPAVNVAQNLDHTVTAPNGDVTVPCNGSDLITYNSTGQVVRQLDHTSLIDGVQNCINNPAVDKNGTLYGVPGGGPNLLAYNGNTLKWEYPAHCDNNGAPPVAVGADGNIYVVMYGHLIGLSPDVAPPLTQPTKVADIAIPTDCSIRLFPYKDGIMLRGQSSGFWFYSYNGMPIGQMSTTHLWDRRVNMSGQVFDYKTVTGSYTSFNANRFDVFNGVTDWDTPASTSGANTSGGPNLYPMEDGGVAVSSTEQKMDPSGSGVPVTPTQWVPGVSIINDAGIKTRSFQLSTDYSNGSVTGNYDTAMTITPDNTGKLVVVRELMLNTKLSWPNPSTVPAIDIGVYDPVTNTWPYHQIMSGDIAKPGGPNGYLWDYSANSVSIAGNTVYLMARCTNNCNGDYNTKLYAIQVSGLGMDYPRGDVLSRTARPSASYVALGDSYSSGEGVSPFEASTDIPGVNTCHRSTNAYARLIAGTSSTIPSLGVGGFRACSGAVTANITDVEQWNESIQLDWWPDTTTQLVTLTIGGNDIGFGNTIETCAWPANNCDAAFQTASQKIATVGDALKTTYTKVLTAMPNAHVYVIGYPPMFAAGTGCVVGPNQTDYPFYTEARKQKAIDLLTALNSKISISVDQVKALNQGYSSRLDFIDAAGSNSPFTGHDVCSSDPYFYGLILQNTTSSFHPNAAGQQAYANLVHAKLGV